MEKMLTEFCHEVNNYFPMQKVQGHFVIEDGSIVVKTAMAISLQNNQYFRIVGSVFNDGVHKYPASTLTDEEFDGAIWSMAVPPAVIDLVAEISAWEEKYGGINSPAMSPYSSESFNNYSYSKGASGGSSSSANPNTWQAIFASRLNKYRRIRGLP